MSKKQKTIPSQPEAMTPRRAIFAIKPNVFLSLFSGRVAYDVTANQLPPDAKILDIRLDTRSGQPGVIEVLLEHPSIPLLVEGEPIPYVKPPQTQAIPSSTPVSSEKI